MSKAFKISVLAISVLLIGVVLLGSLGASGVRAASREGAYRQIEVYSEVLKKIQSDYVEEPNINLVTTGALHGLLESLDADSSYLSPSEYKQYKELQKSGHAQIGVFVSKRFGYATVVSVTPGSPADRAGIEDGDIIEAIGTQTTREMSVATIRGLLEGAPGSSVTFALVRPRKLDPDKITLTRSVVTAPALAEQQYENNSILYLKPGAINTERVKAIEGRIKAASKNGERKILLDLRDVAEGDDAQAVLLANFFLKSGTIATLEGQKYSKQTFVADPSKSLTSAPVAVLVNRGTAGAAEIVAAAILLNNRGDVVGERTFGEGSVQKLMELQDGSALILSIAKYSGPNGKELEEDAVTPNVAVASSDDAFTGAEDEEEATPAPENPVNRSDDQLNKALELLKQKQVSAVQSPSPSASESNSTASTRSDRKASRAMAG